jgi:hypothetical protein
MTQQIISIDQRGPRGPVGPSSPPLAANDGSDGVNGASVLEFNDQTSDNATNGILNLQQYTLAALKLVTNGDALLLSCDYIMDVVTGVKNIYLYLNGAAIHTKLSKFQIQEGVKYALMEAYVIRLSGTSFRIRFKCSKYNELYQEVQVESFYEDVTCNDLDTLTNLFSFRGQASGAGDYIQTIGYNIIKYIK